MLFSRDWSSAECLLAVTPDEGGRTQAVAGLSRQCVCTDGGLGWSPATDIAFAAERGRGVNRRAGIAFVRPDGERVSWIESPGAMDLRWAPDGSRLAWTEGLTHLYVASADGSGVQTVAADARFDDQSPAWSPGSRSVAFVRCRRGCDSIFGDIYVAAVDGGAPAQVTRDGWDAEPSFSPDGRRLAFVHATGRHHARWRIVVADIDGRHRHTVGSRVGQSDSPSWSPRGDSIVYLGGYRDGSLITGPEIREVSPDGTDDHPLARAFEALRKTGSEVSFSWSPRGDRIAFEHLSERERDRNGGIYVVRADGSGLRQLTRVP